MVNMIHTFMSNSYGSNCYIITKGREGILIDSGINPLHLLEKIGKLNMEIRLLINTHCHYDHTAGNSLVVEKTNARLAVHEADAEYVEKAEKKHVLTHLFGADYRGVKVDQRLKGGNVIKVGEVKLGVIHTPGHSEGSICLYESESKSLFSGDTVFSDGTGRTDLPGGSWDELRNSFRKLISLHESKGIDKLYPGHGNPGSGDDIEKIYNLYFGR